MVEVPEHQPALGPCDELDRCVIVAERDRARTGEAANHRRPIAREVQDLGAAVLVPVRLEAAEQQPLAFPVEGQRGGTDSSIMPDELRVNPGEGGGGLVAELHIGPDGRGLADQVPGPLRPAAPVGEQADLLQLEHQRLIPVLAR